MKKLQMVKDIGGTIVGVGTIAIVSSIIKNNRDEEAGAITKLSTAIAGIVIGSMICGKVVSYFNTKVDDVVESLEKDNSKEEDIKA